MVKSLLWLHSLLACCRPSEVFAQYLALPDYAYGEHGPACRCPWVCNSNYASTVCGTEKHGSGDKSPEGQNGLSDDDDDEPAAAAKPARARAKSGSRRSAPSSSAKKSTGTSLKRLKRSREADAEGANGGTKWGRGTWAEERYELHDFLEEKLKEDGVLNQGFQWNEIYESVRLAPAIPKLQAHRALGPAACGQTSLPCRCLL